MRAAQVVGNRAQWCTQPSDEWLLTQPRGAYTTARTVGRVGVFMWSKHVERMRESVETIFGQQAKDEVSETDMLDALRRAHLLLQPEGEAKLTLLVAHRGDSGLEVMAHATELRGKEGQGPVRVSAAARSSGRKRAAAKDSAWVAGRESLDGERRRQRSDDVILRDDDGAFLEGLSSNFFAVRPGNTLATPEHGVLHGTVRSVVLDVCREREIQVALTEPRVEDGMEGAFITSTSRLVLPVSELVPTGDSDAPHLAFTVPQVVRDLADEVERRAAQLSPTVLSEA